MEKPKCSLCGVKHWFTEGHQWPGMANGTKPMANKVLPGMANKKDAIVSMANKEIVAPGANQEAEKQLKASKTVSLTYKYRNQENRKEYMRAYMKNVRARND